MAMPSGNVITSDKMHFPNGGGGVSGGGGGGDIHYHHQQWLTDDGFMWWLRGEFAAANAIIDLLCQHLRLIGEPGEYDGVMGCIQQRRCNWHPVLHMQHYFSVAEVMYALQQVAWRRQQWHFDPVKVPRKEFKRSGVASRQAQRVEIVRDGHNSNVEYYSQAGNSTGSEKGGEVEKDEEPKLRDEVVKLNDKDVLPNPQEDSYIRSSGNSHETTGNSEPEVEELDDGCTENSKGPCNVLLDNDSHFMQTHEKKNLKITPKTFVGTEMFEGKAINVVDGMKLYEELFDVSEVSKLVSLVNNLRTAGKRGQFQGPTFTVSKRPMKGHGREMIQLGIPIADAPPDDENAARTSKDCRTESIPGLLQDVIRRLVGMEVTTVKPDSCIVDIFNEGDHSHPHMWPAWFGRPVCVLFLTECDMTFGKVIEIERPGDYRGSLKLSLGPGSLLVMQGRSADFSKYAISSLRKLRILVTFTKSQPKNVVPSDGQCLGSHPVAPPSHWGPPPSRSPNHLRHPVPKHYGPVSTTGVLPAAPIRPQLAPPNVIQPIFVPTPVASAVTFPAPVALPPASVGWPVAPPRHPQPRLLVPGTGVFLPPPGSSNSAQQLLLTTTTDTSFSAKAPPSLPEKEDDLGKSNGNNCASPKGKVDGKMTHHECNGRMNGTGDGRVVANEEQNVDIMVANNSGGEVE